jgi:hypothetical protein
MRSLISRILITALSFKIPRRLRSVLEPDTHYLDKKLLQMISLWCPGVF